MPSPKPLFIYELANNHMGQVEHGVRVMRELAAASKGFDGFQFAVKLQYRELDSFIHPDYAARSDIKYVKRFQETRLTEDQFKTLRAAMDELGFVSMCTAFDEPSVDMVDRHRYDIIKIGSCSMTDWPMLERITKYDRPIIFSTAGASLLDIDRVVAFFTHREKNVSVMHCIGEYPTADEKLQLNQIDLLRARYPSLRVGYSTHENPDNYDAIQMAIAKGATIFEKHVGVATPELPINGYSATPAQVRQWLEAAQRAFKMCGAMEGRPAASDVERTTLRSLQRGVFAKRKIAKGEKVSLENAFLAIPVVDDQLTAPDLSKYNQWSATADIEPNKPVFQTALKKIDTREKVHEIERRVKAILRESKVVVPGRLELEISHHYGLERFDEFGIAMVTLVNREYCKKLIVVCGGQKHPEQWHKVKEETFHILWGDLQIKLDGVERDCKVGDIVLVERGVKHAFTSRNGCVIEELSSNHQGVDSFYTDEAVGRNKDRKTWVTYWLD